MAKNKLVIIDEGHEIRTDTLKNKSGEENGKKAKATMLVCKYAKKVLILTATPFVNRSQEIINLMAMVNGTKPITVSEFKKKYMNDIEALKQYFGCNISYYKCSKDIADPSYPKVIVRTDSKKNGFINLYMNDTYYKKYTDIEKGVAIKNGLKDGKTVSMNFFVGVRQGSNVLDENNPKESPKVKWIWDFLTKSKNGPVLNPKMKTVIFSGFLDSGINGLARMLDDKGIAFSRISGTGLTEKAGDRGRQMPLAERDNEQKRYNHDKSIDKDDYSNILLISAAGGTGLDLKETRNVILLEPQFNVATEEQALGRAIRRDSHKNLSEDERNVNIYKLMLHKPEKRAFDDPSIIPKGKGKSGTTTKWVSADDAISEMELNKQKVIDEFIKTKVIPLSIEHNIMCASKEK